MEEDDDWLLAWTELFERLLFPLPPIVGVLGVVAFGPFTPPPPPPPPPPPAPPTPAPVLLPLLEGVELSVRDLGPGRRGDGGTWGGEGERKSEREREGVIHIVSVVTSYRCCLSSSSFLKQLLFILKIKNLKYVITDL